MMTFEELKEENRELKGKKLNPEWVNTIAWQQIKYKYLASGETCVKDMFTRVANSASKMLPESQVNKYNDIFFNLLWNNWLVGSTPVLSNMGTNRGLNVSCSGNYVEDSVYGFYNSYLEEAMLSKHGFGTSSYLGAIRPRGSKISTGGIASGILPVFKMCVNTARDITQGGQRRGAWAGYIPIDHNDFWEVSHWVFDNQEDVNVGWIVSNNFIDRLNSGDEDAIARYQWTMKIKCIWGKGYFFFVDKVNALKPPTIKNKIHASNLCTEIMLPSSPTETFTCVLSSMNIARYDEWKTEDAVYNSTIFLDCVAEYFIKEAENYTKMENSINFTKKYRALGLGQLGFHSYLQDNMIPFESLEAQYRNMEIAKHIWEKSLLASQDMAKEYGEPEACKGFGVRNATRIAIAPNFSSSLGAGGVSQGIEPWAMVAFNQDLSCGDVKRIVPTFLKLAKARGKYSEVMIQDIIENQVGSVRNLKWLTEHEKLVFKTAFEIDQKVIIRLASQRQKYIDQAQSINLFFSADEKEDYISEVHQLAFMDPNIKSLYYLRSEKGVQASKSGCISCES